MKKNRQAEYELAITLIFKNISIKSHKPTDVLPARSCRIHLQQVKSCKVLSVKFAVQVRS